MAASSRRALLRAFAAGRERILLERTVHEFPGRMYGPVDARHVDRYGGLCQLDSKRRIHVETAHLKKSESPTAQHGMALAEDDVRRKILNRSLYRSRQRGYLELDLLLGKWAEANLAQLDAPMVEALTVLLEEENPDLWKWLTGQIEAPAETAKNPVFVALHAQVMESLELHSNPDTRATRGAVWVRGWDDRDKRMPGVSPTGNQ